MSKIRVIVKTPDQVIGKVQKIDNTLEALQEIVGGRIETVTVRNGTVVIICNEEGLLEGLPYNCEIEDNLFVGTIIAAGVDGEEFADLPIVREAWEDMIGW